MFGRKGVAAADYSSTRATTCPVPSPDNDPLGWAALSGGGWGRLNADVSAGDASFATDRPVTFDAGDKVIITTTDWFVNHTEYAVVSDSVQSGQRVSLSAPLSYRHLGMVTQIDPSLTASNRNPNGAVDARAAFALLSRSIVVRSLGATANGAFPSPSACGTDASGSVDPACFFGGHVMVRQGFAAFQVQGVEFYQLGQGGRMGHYPIHFHLAKSAAYANAFVRDSSIWDSMTRFITLHGTQHIELSRNVGYLSVGHGFYLEDGSEINNILCYNLGVSARAATIEMALAQDPESALYRAVPGILDATGTNSGNPTTNANTNFQGSDYLQPTMFWIMNAANEFVGNMAVGCHGYGSCYWLLGSSLSGASYSMHWTSGTYTIEDAPTWISLARQVPLARFRGNQCGTATYALQTSINVDPANLGISGYSFLQTPYSTAINHNFMRPQIGGNFVPSMPNSQMSACPSQLPWNADASQQTVACVATVIDRLRASFNFPSVSFGAVWLRESWFLVTNSAITDQLSGGLGFVSGGDWTQAPAGYFAIAFDSVFIGSTNPSDMYAGEVGPSLASLSCAAVCTLPVQGTGVFTGGFAPKRMMSIYDGPFLQRRIGF
eukprot:Opistho-2@43806